MVINRLNNQQRPGAMVRDWWTKKLERIVQDIEAGKLPVPVRELYLCGAYARGELDPPELNIIVIHDEPPPALIEQYRLQANPAPRSFMAALSNGMRQFERHLFKILRRPTERIDIHHGATLNHAYIPTNHRLEGLVFLWSPMDRDWQGKIAAIPVPDILQTDKPLPTLIQLPDALREEGDYLTQQVALQQLSIQRIPLIDLPPLAMEEALLFLATPELLDHWGVHTKPLFPYACSWLTTQEVRKAMACDGCIIFDHDFRFRIQVGKPHFRKLVKHFDRPALEKQCYIPFLKRGYPKDLFVIERGAAWSPTAE